MRSFAGLALMAMQYNSIVILGATATGKTALGVYLARLIGGEIISADSRQVYRGLDIGSGKDLSEYGEVPYHLVDIADLQEEYNVFSFQRDVYRVFPEVIARGRVPVIVGGTGMYLDAVIRGYSMIRVPENEALRKELTGCSIEELSLRLLSLKNEVHNSTDLLDRDRLIRAIEIAEYNRSHGTAIGSGNNPESDCVRSDADDPAKARPDIRPLILGVRFERPVLRARIKRRFDARLAEGLVHEVSVLHENGANWERLERLGLEYRFTAEFLQGKIQNEKDYIDSLGTAICQFAKRQETWFRGMERKGVTIHWIQDGKREDAVGILFPFFPLRQTPPIRQ